MCAAQDAQMLEPVFCLKEEPSTLKMTDSTSTEIGSRVKNGNFLWKTCLFLSNFQ